MARCRYFAVFIALVPTVLCCGNMDVVLKEVNTNCADGSTSIFKLSNDFNFMLGDDCTLQPIGCIEMTKDVSSAMIHYKMATAVVPLAEGDADVCDLMKNATANKDIEMVMNLFRFPKNCPVKTSKICAGGKTFSLAQYKNHMILAPGKLNGEVVIDHNDTGKSCINFAIEATPKPLPP